MRSQNESKAVWLVAVVLLSVIFILRCFDMERVVLEPDMTFLYNRCWQMRDCLRHGFYPFLYYNDVGGVGYGSPIFYGQLSLVPFFPFLANILSFAKAYSLCCLLLNFFGFRFFLKRMSNNATLSACFYIVGLPFIFTYTAGMYAAQLAVGVSWFFFGYCIDFFRDNRNSILLILTYFAIWQCNLNSVVFSSVVCFLLFITYFDMTRWRSYLKVVAVVGLLISYNVSNILVHRDAIRLSDYSQLFTAPPEQLRVLFSSVPLGGFLFRALYHSLGGGDLCCGLMQFGVFGLLVYYYWRYARYEGYRFRVYSMLVFIASAFLYTIGVWLIWGYVDKVTEVFFQYPIRYLIYVWGFLVLVLSRVVKQNKVTLVVLVLCIVDLFVANPLTASTLDGEADFLLTNIVRGEYAGRTFVYDNETFEEFSSVVHATSGADYSFVNEYNGLSVDCSANSGDDVLTLPKLYYFGYKAVGDDGEMLEVVSGYSNYCQVSLGGFKGTLRVWYQVPALVMFFFCVQCCIVGYLILWLFWERWVFLCISRRKAV